MTPSHSAFEQFTGGYVLVFDRAAVLANMLADVALFPTHAASGVIFRRIKPDALFPGLHQLRDSSARQHVDLEFAAVQLFAKMRSVFSSMLS